MPKSTKRSSKRQPPVQAAVHAPDLTRGEFIAILAAIPTGLYEGKVGGRLAGIRLDGLDLHGMDLAGINFRCCSFRGCNLQNTSLFGSFFYDADFAGADLRGVDVELDEWPACFRDAVFDFADLSRSNFAGAEIESASFRGANLSQSNFEGAKALWSADFTGANVAGAKFSDHPKVRERVAAAMNTEAAVFVAEDPDILDSSTAATSIDDVPITLTVGGEKWRVRIIPEADAFEGSLILRSCREILIGDSDVREAKTVFHEAIHSGLPADAEEADGLKTAAAAAPSAA